MNTVQEIKMKPFNFGTLNEPIQHLGIWAQTDSGDIQIGVWESGPGVLNLDFQWSETVYILEGRAEIENMITQERFELKPGMMLLFEAGSRWRWHIPWRLKKVFTIIDR
ncbi:MAG: DUF861 domain-containing protein [Bdellovibrionaceae bacterium]|jgi:uncharacterized cupin superfamily protein|nr:DUF861 domain-containing protein [Pseudobdellovibrionaceae bacterium]